MKGQNHQFRPFNPFIDRAGDEEEPAVNYRIREDSIIGQALEKVTIDHYVASEAVLVAESVKPHSMKGDVDEILLKAAEQRYDSNVVPVLANEMGWIQSSTEKKDYHSRLLEGYLFIRLPEPDETVRPHLDGAIGNFKRPYFFSPAQVQEILQSESAVGVREAYVSVVVEKARNLLGMISETNH